MSIKGILIAVLIAFFMLFTGVGFAAPATGGNFVVNGDFETGNTDGWIWNNANRGTGIWMRTVEMDGSGNQYLRLAKNWWGYNRFYQDIAVTAADLEIGFSFWPVQLGQPGLWDVQERVSVVVEMYDQYNVRQGYVQHYFATYHNHVTSGADINIKLGDAQTDDWVHISYSLKDMVLNYEPDFDFSTIVRIRVWLKNFQVGHARQWSIGYFDDISVTEKKIDAAVEVNPRTLNTKSKGKWITAYIQLPAQYDVCDIDGSTITLNYLNQGVSAEPAPTAIDDYNNDGVFDLMVKFKRADVSALLSGIKGPVVLSVSGELYDGAKFLGEDSIRVK